MQLEGRAKIYAITQAVISSLGFLSSFIGAVFLLIFGLLGGLIDPQTSADAGLMLVIGWTSLLIAIAFLIALVSAIFSLLGKPIPKISPATKQIILGGLVLIWIISILVVMLTSRFQALSLVTSFFILPLVLVPILAFFSIGSHNLSLGNHRRTWGAIAFNFAITMPLVLMVELFLFVIIFVIIGLWLTGQPELLGQIMQYSEQFSNGTFETLEAQRLLTELISQPIFFNGSILVIAILVPLIEELFKPMAIWFLAGKRLTPAQGFVGGLIGGGCFAMLESLGAVGIPADSEWLILLFGRTGTGLLHISLSGLVGWGFASGFYNQKWGRAIFTYLMAVTIHGLWNFFALLSGIVPILPMADDMQNLPVLLGQVGVFVMVGLFIINMVLLVSVNRQLQHQPAD
ncbi:MAG TPA: PrsW family glutamic-type intramembrane protease [Anaerolineaceae bacterium]|nr:PrsW family glutamic-type intramembrane protease [Anaerolineaceae bacterium]